MNKSKKEKEIIKTEEGEEFKQLTVGGEWRTGELVGDFIFVGRSFYFFFFFF